MERQIPRSIQYSDLKPEVIENQVKLVRFTPQTNIQNQVPNDVVRFQLVGNGFFDPYSSYIYMSVDFGADTDNFTIAKPPNAENLGLAMLYKYWKNSKLYLSGAQYEAVGGHVGTAFVEDQTIGCNLGASELNFQNMIVQVAADGTAKGGLTNFGGAASLSIITFSNETFGHLAATLALDDGNDATNGVAERALTVANSILSKVGTTVLSGFTVQLSTQNQGAAYQGRQITLSTNGSSQRNIPIPGTEFKMLDRSAHSFINRLVVRSQGTEIERIEQYDVVAAMLNDLIYSNEQAQFHAFEGFGGAPYIQTNKVSSVLELHRSTVANSISGPRGRVGERIWGWAFVAIGESLADDCETELNFDLTAHGSGTKFFRTLEFKSTISRQFTVQMQKFKLLAPLVTASGIDLVASTDEAITDDTHIFTQWGITMSPLVYERNVGSVAELAGTETLTDTLLARQLYKPPVYEVIFKGNYHHPIAKFIDKYVKDKNSVDVLEAGIVHALSDVNVGFFRSGDYRMIPLGAQQYEFIIPIYSGLIGVLMPEKKLLPLSLLPLEVDFTLNPHALMAGYSNGYGGMLSRNYTMKKMEIFSHMVFFEQEIHRSMESIVAEHGLFLHINTFYMAPVTLHGTSAVTQTIAINLHFKNINSIHMVNMYTNYLTSMSARKLHFVSHNLRSIQIRNGSDLIPSEPIVMESQSTNAWEKTSISSGRYNKIFLELLKSYNKMHDPTCDTALDNGLCYQMDNYADISSRLASDFDLSGTTFSDNRRRPDYAVTRMIRIGTHVPSQAAALTFLNKYIMEAVITVAGAKQLEQFLPGCKVPTIDEVRGMIRAERLGGSSTDIFGGIAPRGSWGVNPRHIGMRPTMFYAPTCGSISQVSFTEGEYFGLSASLLKDKIARFTALTGRCQFAISLEGINLGTDNSMLCGKRGMIPFDIMAVGDKSDSAQSMTLVFAKCDFIVYVRPDLVVTVLGR